MACGNIGEPICKEGNCLGWFVNTDGTCSNPFKVYPEADVDYV